MNLPQSFLDYHSKLEELNVFYGEEHYVSYFELEEIEELTKGYNVEEYLPNHVMFASNGGIGCFLFNENGEVFETDYIGMGDYYVKVGTDFLDFLNYLKS